MFCYLFLLVSAASYVNAQQNSSSAPKTSTDQSFLTLDELAQDACKALLGDGTVQRAFMINPNSCQYQCISINPGLNAITNQFKDGTKCGATKKCLAGSCWETEDIDSCTTKMGTSKLLSLSASGCSLNCKGNGSDVKDVKAIRKPGTSCDKPLSWLFFFFLPKGKCSAGGHCE